MKSCGLKRFFMSSMLCASVLSAVISPSLQANAQVDEHVRYVYYNLHLLKDSDHDGLSDLYELVTGDTEFEHSEPLPEDLANKRKGWAPLGNYLASGDAATAAAISTMDNSYESMKEDTFYEYYMAPKDQSRDYSEVRMGGLTQADLDILKTHGISFDETFYPSELFDVYSMVTEIKTSKERAGCETVYNFYTDIELNGSVHQGGFEFVSATCDLDTKPVVDVLMDSEASDTSSLASNEVSAVISDESNSLKPTVEIVNQPNKPTSVEEVIPFDVAYIADESLAAKQEVVEIEGIDGLKVDGQIVREPVRKVVKYGPVVEESVIESARVVEFDDAKSTDFISVIDGRNGSLVKYYDINGEVYKELQVDAIDTKQVRGLKVELNQSVRFAGLEVGKVYDGYVHLSMSNAKDGLFDEGQPFVADGLMEPVRLVKRFVATSETMDIPFEYSGLLNKDADWFKDYVQNSVEPLYLVHKADASEVTFTVKSKDAPFKTISKYNDQLKEGERRVIREGKFGRTDFYYDEDGALVDMIVKSEPLDELVEVGTKKDEGLTQVTPDLDGSQEKPTTPIKNEEEIIARYPIKFSERVVEDPTSSESKVLQEGVDGEYAVVKNSKGELRYVVTKHPVAKVTAKGTKAVDQTVKDATKKQEEAAKSTVTIAQNTNGSNGSTNGSTVNGTQAQAANGSVVATKSDATLVESKGQLLPLTGEQTLAILGGLAAIVVGVLGFFGLKLYGKKGKDTSADDAIDYSEIDED